MVFNLYSLLWVLLVPCYWDYFPSLIAERGSSNHTARSIFTINKAKWFMASFLFLRFCRKLEILEKKIQWSQRWSEMHLFRNNQNAGPECITLRRPSGIQFLSCETKKAIGWKFRSNVLTPVPFISYSIPVKLFSGIY